MIPKPEPLSPFEFVQVRLRLIRAGVKVQGTPAANSQAIDDMRRLIATVDALDERLKGAERERDTYRSTAQGLQLERDQLQGWQRVAHQSNEAIDVYLRLVKPDLPEHYGMPGDGVRLVVEGLTAERDAYRRRAEAMERERDAATGYARMRLAEDLDAARDDQQRTAD